MSVKYKQKTVEVKKLTISGEDLRVLEGMFAAIISSEFDYISTSSLALHSKDAFESEYIVTALEIEDLIRKVDDELN